MSVLYTLHCDGIGCRRTIEAVGKVEMPAGWSEFSGIATIGQGPMIPPIVHQVTKHYCIECRHRLREHGVAPAETVVMGPDALPESTTPGIAKCECGFRWPPRSKYAACPKCGRARDPDAPRIAPRGNGRSGL